ncbi:nitrogen fixation protein NifX [Halothece sp. PCC 7418]|uniref:nitrogen fixation protein NifX n=1 Tax=Halothece sp. (strain PCC 7418) TaxID=65093 RepID=UPI0002A0759F|nr:nitrogen fixation protein NifX [Halothece sp. PCC 7418]AFZ43960.1 nitrogen fixation protein NifX [Halothece sp. PCC 7418]
MKVAFATQDNIHINAHFGWAKKFDIYDVSVEGYDFLQTIDFGENLKEDGKEDKLIPKMNAVADCAIVYVSAIGGSAAYRLLQAEVTPLKVENQQEEITNVLNRLIQTLGNPPPWLRKTLRQKVTLPNFDE